MTDFRHDRDIPPGPPGPAFGIIIAGLLIVGALCLLLSAYEAKAHSWFTGAKDPVTQGTCCDGRDCFEIADTDVVRVAGGYVYKPLDNNKGPSIDNPGFIPDARVQPSKTFGFAICLGGGKYSTGAINVPMFVRCFFAASGF